MAVAYFVHVETNYTGDAEFELEAGYDYGVYSMTNGNDANDPSKWGFEGSPTQIAGTTRGRLTMSDIQPITKKWYRLVRYGKAPVSPNWTLDGIAADPDPIRYYMVDRARFLSVMEVDWKWDLAISRGLWGDWLISDVAEFYGAVEIASGAVAVPGELPRPLPFPIPEADLKRLRDLGTLTTTLLRRIAQAAVIVAIIQKTPAANVLYERQSFGNPSQYYSGRSWGLGRPTDIMKARNEYHHKNGSHDDPVLKAYIQHKGFHTYAYVAAVGREQQMIDARGGFRGENGYLLGLTNSTNGRREVAEDNELSAMYWNTSNDAFGGSIAPFTGIPNPPLPQHNVVWPRAGIVPQLEGPIIKIAPPASLVPE